MGNTKNTSNLIDIVILLLNQNYYKSNNILVLIPNIHKSIYILISNNIYKFVYEKVTLYILRLKENLKDLDAK